MTEQIGRGSGGGGDLPAAAAYQAFGHGQSIPGDNSEQRVELTDTSFDTLGGVDLANDRIVTQEAGIYYLTGAAAIDFQPVGSGDYFNVRVAGSGAPETKDGITTGSENFQDAQTAGIVQLPAGSEIGMFVRQDSGSSLDIFGDDYTTRVGVVRLGST